MGHTPPFAAAFLDNLGVMAAVPGDRRRELFMLALAAVPKDIGEEVTRHRMDAHPAPRVRQLGDGADSFCAT